MSPSPDSSFRRSFYGLLFDLGLWFTPPTAFLVIYVTYYYFPNDAIVAHLYVFTFAFLGMLALRTAAHLFLPPRAALALSSLLLASAFLILLLVYMLATIGLSSWGNLPTVGLLVPYVRDWTVVIQILGISTPTVIGTAVLTYTLLLLLFHTYLVRFDWIPQFCQSQSPRILPIVVIATVVGVTIKAYEFVTLPLGNKAEPISLMLFPETAQIRFQTHPIPTHSILGSKEDLARASYHELFRASSIPTTRNVIVIVADALRPDRMSIYGYERRTTPSLEEQLNVADVRIIERAYSTCAESSCGIYSILNSRYPSQMVTRPFGLADVLSMNGYRVQAVLSGDHTNFYGLRNVYGSVDGFFDSTSSGLHAVNDDRILLEWLEQLSMWDGIPTMLHFHIMSSHGLSLRLDEHKQWHPETNYALRGLRRRDPVHVANFYDNGVSQADFFIGEILRSLADKGYLSDALVVVTGDHGEALGEHGLFSHSNTVYEPIIRVPLIFLSYGYALSAAIPEDVVASQVDIAPSILADLAIEPPTIWVGTALQDNSPRLPIFFQQGPEVGLIDSRGNAELWKYWRNTRSGQEFVFDLLDDPAEMTNLVRDSSCHGCPANLLLEWRRRVFLHTTSGN